MGVSAQPPSIPRRLALSSSYLWWWYIVIRTGVPCSWYSYFWMCHWMASFMQCNVDIYSIHSDVTYSLATSGCGGLFSLKVDIKMSSKIEPVLPPSCLKKLCLNDSSLQMPVSQFYRILRRPGLFILWSPLTHPQHLV